MVATLGHWRFRVKDIEEHGLDLTLAELELVGQGALSGAAFAGTVHQICRWRDGRTTEVMTFSDRDSALAALS
jgi:ketosteroid isomerase-like protein